jgi:heme/copper-type cytochrome/quinol oxidase subunit 2
MKKFLLLIFFFLYSFSSTAHMAHYNKYSKIEMEILKDGEVIGYNYYFFKKDKNETIVTNQIKFTC